MRLRFTLYPYNLPAICFSRWPIALSHRPCFFPISPQSIHGNIARIFWTLCRCPSLHFTHIGATPIKRGGVYRWKSMYVICCCSLYYLIGIGYGRHQRLLSVYIRNELQTASTMLTTLRSAGQCLYPLLPIPNKEYGYRILSNFLPIQHPP